MAEEVVPSDEVSTKNHISTLHEEVARTISESGPKVRQRVIELMVEEKLEERKKLVLDALNRLKQCHQELPQLQRKGRQDFDEANKPVGKMVYTKEQSTEIDKAKQKLNRLETALNNALGDKADYQKLHEVMQKSGGGEKKEEKKDGE